MCCVGVEIVAERDQTKTVVIVAHLPARLTSGFVIDQ
jgi:hypothetical protein